MIIVGICGAIGSGKSTLAELLTGLEPDHSVHLETSTVVRELANLFNEALRQTSTTDDDIVLVNQLIPALLPTISTFAGREVELGEVTVTVEAAAADPVWYDKLWLYFEQVRQNPDLLQQEITIDNKSNYRAILQWIGGYFLYKIDPLLWHKELSRRIKRSGKNFKLVALTALRQPDEANYVKSIGGQVIMIERPELVSDTTDATERRVREIIPDISVTNDGSIQQLRELAVKLLEDLRRHNQQPIYTASTFKG